MNILVEQFPTTVSINGKQVEVNSDFRSCLKIILAFEDNELTPQEKQMILFNNMYGELPDDLREAAVQAVKFLNGGKDKEEGEDEAPGPTLYSFSKDASFIFSAMKQTHGIELDKAELHWWKFLALFMDLGPETTFSNLVGLRSRLADGTASKDDRKLARKMGSMVEVQQADDRTLEEKEAADKFFAAVEKAQQARKK